MRQRAGRSTPLLLVGVASFLEGGQGDQRLFANGLVCRLIVALRIFIFIFTVASYRIVSCRLCLSGLFSLLPFLGCLGKIGGSVGNGKEAEYL